MRYYNEAIAMTNNGLFDYTNNDVNPKCQKNVGVENEVCVWGGGDTGEHKNTEKLRITGRKAPIYYILLQV